MPTRVGGWETAKYPYRTRILSSVANGRIHYTAGPSSSTVQAIAAYQTGPNAQEDFPAIAYHYVVTEDGAVHWCHDLHYRVWGSGAPGSNEHDVHVCYTGNVEPNPVQLIGIRTALRHAERELGRTLTAIRPHNADYPTACPGPKWDKWKDAVLP